MEGTIGEIRIFAGNFAPRTWMICKGQVIRIADNSALFSVFGTMYGGDGRTTFALPDLRGRNAIGAGQGEGLPNYKMGEMEGDFEITLTKDQMPTHTHTVEEQNIILNASKNNADNSDPTGNVLAKTGDSTIYVSDSNPSQAMGETGAKLTLGVGETGNNAPVNIMQPYVAMHYIVCVTGIFPNRK